MDWMHSIILIATLPVECQPLHASNICSRRFFAFKMGYLAVISNDVKENIKKKNQSGKQLRVDAWVLLLTSQLGSDSQRML